VTVEIAHMGSTLLDVEVEMDPTVQREHELDLRGRPQHVERDEVVEERSNQQEEPERPLSDDELVDEQGGESFPAGDPPAH
jgi:hypothetical protein